jgi:hypothetical protein
MELLINAADVILYAIPGKNLRQEWIKDSVIILVQEKYLLPLIGNKHESVITDNLYNRLVGTPYSSLTDDEKTLVDEYIKPMLCFYVKHQILPDIFAQMTNLGVQQNNTEHSSSVSNSDKNILRAQAKEDAETYADILIRYLNDNEALFPLYNCGDNKRTKISHVGGIIFKRK